MDQFIEKGPSRCLEKAALGESMVSGNRSTNFSRPGASLQRVPPVSNGRSQDLRSETGSQRSRWSNKPTRRGTQEGLTRNSSNNSSSTRFNSPGSGSSQVNIFQGITRSPWARMASTTTLAQHQGEHQRPAFLEPHRQKIRWIHVPNLQVDMVPVSRFAILLD
jgi:hypothetical protein